MNKHFKKFSAMQKGFTIIELIVVIAIIAVLAAIVLVNVTQYINKGKDASIKGNMSSMMTVAASYYDDPAKGANSYTNLFNDTTMIAGIRAINDADGNGTLLNYSISTAFCIQTNLNAGGAWCVDSNGYKGNATGCDVNQANCQ